MISVNTIIFIYITIHQNINMFLYFLPIFFVIGPVLLAGIKQFALNHLGNETSFLKMNTDL